MTDLESILLFCVLVAMISQVAMYYFYSKYTRELEKN